MSTSVNIIKVQWYEYMTNYYKISMNTPPKTHRGRRMLAPSGASSFLLVPESESPKKRPKITFQN